MVQFYDYNKDEKLVTHKSKKDRVIRAEKRFYQYSPTENQPEGKVSLDESPYDRWSFLRRKYHFLNTDSKNIEVWTLKELEELDEWYKINYPENWKEWADKAKILPSVSYSAPLSIPSEKKEKHIPVWKKILLFLFFSLFAVVIIKSLTKYKKGLL
jgi:hypothetical protein